MQNERYIFHIDMDAFFAAIEQRDNFVLRTIKNRRGMMGRRDLVLFIVFTIVLFSELSYGADVSETLAPEDTQLKIAEFSETTETQATSEETTEIEDSEYKELLDTGVVETKSPEFTKEASVALTDQEKATFSEDDVSGDLAEANQDSSAEERGIEVDETAMVSKAQVVVAHKSSNEDLIGDLKTAFEKLWRAGNK